MAAGSARRSFFAVHRRVKRQVLAPALPGLPGCVDITPMRERLNSVCFPARPFLPKHDLPVKIVGVIFAWLAPRDPVGKIRRRPVRSADVNQGWTYSRLRVIR